MTNCFQVYGHKEKADEPRQRGNSGAHSDCDAVVVGGGGVGGGHGGYGDGNRYGGAGVIIILSSCLSL